MAAAEKLSYDELGQRLEELPTLPSIVYEVNQIINDPMSSTKDVEKVMSNDQSLTTKVLKLANSAYYAVPGGVSNLARAIAYIGYDTIQQLVLAASIIDALNVNSSDGFDLNEFWRHSMGAGMAAETIAKSVGHPNPPDLFTCGLVHDMGKVALYSLAPDMLKVVVDHVKKNDSSFYDAEVELDFPQHDVLGGHLAEKWKLPVNIRTATRYHHVADPKERTDVSQELNLTVDIVYLANLLVHALKFGNSGHNKVMGAPKSVLDRLQLDNNSLKDLIKEIKEALKSADAFLKIIGGQ